MQPNDKGGDGVPPSVTPTTGEPPVIELQGETSSTPAELDARIDAELQDLGVPSNLIPKGATDEEPAETPAEDAEPEPSEPASEEDAETPPETSDEEPVEEPAEKAPAEAATPSDEDLFIEVEDADGVTHKISKIEDLPEDFQPKSNRQGLEILRDLAKLEDEMVAREQDRAVAAEQAERQAVQQEQFTAWDKEIDNLGKEKRIDAKDQETIDNVFKLMTQINTERARLGNPNMITSFEDALDKYEAQQVREADSKKTQADNDRAKAKASLIGGTSAPAGNRQPAYVSGSYRDIDDIPL